MGVGKKLLGLFVEVTEDEGKEDSSPKKEKQAAPSVTPPAAIPVQTAAPMVSAAGEANQTILESLAGALEAANLPNFDYFEYAKTTEALKNSIPSEQVRYQTAFTTAAVMGVTKQILLDAAEHYLGVLDTEAKKFDGFVQDQTQVTITDKQGALLDIDNQINDRAAQMQKLTEEINTLTQQRAAITNEVSENQIKIQKVQNDFSATMKIFVDRISGDIEKINKYIP